MENSFPQSLILGLARPKCSHFVDTLQREQVAHHLRQCLQAFRALGWILPHLGHGVGFLGRPPRAPFRREASDFARVVAFPPFRPADAGLFILTNSNTPNRPTARDHTVSRSSARRASPRVS